MKNDDLEVTAYSLVERLPVTKKKLTQMKLATAQDEILQRLSKVVKNGWPSHNLPVAIGHYWSMRDEIHKVEGLFVLGVFLVFVNVSPLQELSFIGLVCVLNLKE